MALILEDGSGKTNSQTYVLGADVAAYARLYGLAPPVSADADPRLFLPVQACRQVLTTLMLSVSERTP